MKISSCTKCSRIQAHLKKLQIKWKKIGHAGRHLEQKLWHNFRTKCDEFFEKKDKENKAKKV